MGTSGSYPGPNRPLLPKDFEDDFPPIHPFDPKDYGTPEKGQKDRKNPDDSETYPPDNNDSIPDSKEGSKPYINPSSWGYTKREMSRYASGSSKSHKHALSSYVRSSGGADNRAKAARSGVATTVRLWSFLNTISNSGIEESLKDFRIQYKDRNANQVITDIINAIAPPPNTKEDAAARDALIDTMETLSEISDFNGDISALDNLSQDNVRRIIEIYISSYIYEGILSDLGYRIEKSAKTAVDVIKKEKEIEEYIKGSVAYTLSKKTLSGIDVQSKEVSKIVQELYKDCYQAIEGAIK